MYGGKNNMGKRSTEYFCNNCYAEYMVIYDPDESNNDPDYCPFCCAAREDDDAFEDFDS